MTLKTLCLYFRAGHSTMVSEKERLIPGEYVSTQEGKRAALLKDPVIMGANLREQSRHRHLSNLMRFVICALLLVGGVWVVNEVYLYSCSPSGENTETGQSPVLMESVIMVSEEEEFIYFDSAASSSPSQPSCDVGPVTKRFDCFQGSLASKAACEARGCCWGPTGDNPTNITSSGEGVNVPWCYFPSNYQAVSYQADSIKETVYGYRVTIQNRGTGSKWPPSTINTLQMDVYLESDSRVHFKIIDPHVTRYEVPIDTPNVQTKATNPNYDVKIQKNPVGIIITRKKTGAVVFDSTVAPLLYGDQYLQISTSVPAGFVYGLGEHRSRMMHNLSSWDRLTLWARDEAPIINANLYGVHPFYITLEKDSQANGVFFLNSNAMDIDLQPYPALTYRTIGGVVDFYVFLGTTPASVVEEYVSVIGRPAFPPYWSLGFHLCRYGYTGSDEIKSLVERMRKAGFPYDTQWSDIDYMDKFYDWTYDKEKFAGLPDLVTDLHNHDQHFVLIVDPGISNQSPGKYPPYDTGIKLGVFINDSNGQPIVGKVWPGQTVFPDFTNPRTEEWWYQCAKDFHQEIQFDGLWTDMNEPSNFGAGSMKGCTSNKLDKPPYMPGVLGGKLEAKTLCASAKQYLGSHYDLHSLFGHFETRATHRALLKLRKKRSLVITRSSFVGTGQYAGHWSGDNQATWDNLYYSIPLMMSFQMFGIPLVGADICGFQRETTEELCTRWMQLGAFYPFMRNHNDLRQKAQDPTVFSQEAQQRMKVALDLRYKLLPYLYTLLFRSHVNGSPVINPLSFIYPGDANTHPIDRQFLFGEAFLITPVLTPATTTVRGYIPNGVWYTTEGPLFPHSGEFVEMNATLDYIPLLIRGGFITPWQDRKHNETTTVQTRLLPFSFTVALDSSNEAVGELFWDDGESINTTEAGLYSLFDLKASQGKLTSSVVRHGYKPDAGLWMEHVTVLGIQTSPKDVLINGVSTKFQYDQGVMVVSGLRVDMLKGWTVEWTS